MVGPRPARFAGSSRVTGRPASGAVNQGHVGVHEKALGRLPPVLRAHQRGHGRLEGLDLAC